MTIDAAQIEGFLSEPRPLSLWASMGPKFARTALDAIAAREAAERERDALREALQKLADEYADPSNESEGPAYKAARAALKETPK